MLVKLNFPQINKMAKEIVLGKIERIALLQTISI